MKNKNWKVFGWLFPAVLMLITIMPSMKAQATNTGSKTYTITIRTGNTGTFDVKKISTTNTEVTENYIRYTLIRGNSLKSAEFFKEDSNLYSFLEHVLIVEDGYFLRPISDWANGAVGKTISRNTEYVLDYGKLVDPVEYSISYVDSQSGEQIATPTIAYKNDGDTVECFPLAIEGYTTTNESIRMTLKKGGTNSVTFSYTYTGENGTTTNIVTTYLPGETITQTVYNDTYQNLPMTDGDEGNEAGEAAGTENEEIDIFDQPVPLTEAEDSEVQEDGEVEIVEDGEVPLGSLNEEGKSILIPIFSGVIAVVGGIAIIFLMKKKRQ